MNLNDINTNGTATLDELRLDAAVAEALGNISPDDAEVLARALEAADDRHRTATMELRETVARMSAASPYMEPPARLRDAVIRATAPVNFSYEAYRQKNAEPAAWYVRWGLVAAVLFLTAGAYYNIYMRNQAQKATQTVAVLSKQADTQARAIQMLLDPKVVRNPVVATVDNHPETVGVWLVDPATKESKVVLPATALRPGTQWKITVSHDGTKDDMVADVVGVPDLKMPAAAKNAPHVDVTSVGP